MKTRTSLYCALTAVTVASAAAFSAEPTAGPPKKFYGGAGVGRFTLNGEYDKWQCKYDMVLVERIQGKAKTESGLFVPEEDLPKLHLCRVISMGPGREEENGRIAPMPDLKAGDVVVAKNPWGIGPKDEETADGQKLSFMRSQDIAAVLEGNLYNQVQ
uniref:Uncharacterized protein n=1 Tax=Eucampia antarctica TaxID=49252 RepID=A0A7S2R6Q1_9STRA|mmetsp:Transcript_17756/g.17159  ORF Transcript_17756/g.17159 Transcript_17756/m.17159 type:complete len:158 (+) Transcript_17756:89-562(+)|eukprot:CAMPEP_0197824028 /NCGR_PEP_ID=MMETSP1437-20131217/1343_1 /TAXON_ID=49252 ORGANISM="Eucampia antarctica, Strain CCMP1452" /NCGR_SAMPLE_ID=MMETSP1437 /ASSEMBLY_ACC=CAM_ASM_001096 /LENGTH=157 /DNA_ID=CAMNT_0043423499 /DNA_START=89 /DNA_END=562 /DNA_ORIENTATION=+